MSEVVNTAPVTEAVNTETTETEGQEVAATQGETDTGKVATSEQTQLDAVQQLMASQQLPPEVKYFKDPKTGKLMFQVPIDGKNYTVDFAGIVKGFNLNQAGYKKLEEGKAIQKQFEGFVERLKENPDELWAFAERVGLDPIKLAQGRLQKAVDESSMTDEQKELAAFKREKEAFEKEKETHKKTIEEQRIAQESAKYQNKYSEDLITALKKQNISADSTSFNSMKGIAKEAVKKVRSALEKGIDMSMEDAVLQARQDIDANIQDFLMSVDDDHIIDALPSKFVDRILKASLNRKVGTPTTNTVGKPVALKESGTSKKTKKQAIGDYFNNLKA